MPQEEHVRTEGARVTVREGETLTRRIEMPIVCGEPGDGWVDSGRLLRGELAFSCRRDDASTAERLVHRVRIEGLAERLCLGANRMMTVAVKPAWEGQLVLPRGERVRVRVSSLSTRDLSDRCLLRVDGRLASPILAGPAPLFDEPLAGGRAVPLTLDCGGDRGELASIACGVPFAFGENGVPVAGVPREANLERVVLTVTAEPSP